MRDQDERSGNPNLRLWFVYTLHDPRQPNVVRYVGWTTNPSRRLKTHIRDARNGRDQTRCGNWKRSLLTFQVTPVMEIVESGVGGGYGASEIRWVAHFREKVGEKLTNLTNGGDGTSGRVNSPEHRARISAYRKGRKASVEARSNMRAAHLGKKLPPEQIKKIADANRGRKQSLEERQKKSIAGKRRTLEAIEKTASANRGRKRSAESRAKMRAAHLGVPLSPEHARNAAKARVGRQTSEDTKLKIQTSLKAHYAKHGPRKLSAEARAKISAALKTYRAGKI